MGLRVPFPGSQPPDPGPISRNCTPELYRRGDRDVEPDAPDPPAGSAVPPDPILRSKNKKSVRQKTFPANKSSPLLPERSREQLSHCTTSTITNCFAVSVSALSPQATASPTAPASRQADQRRGRPRCSWRRDASDSERSSECDACAKRRSCA